MNLCASLGLCQWCSVPGGLLCPAAAVAIANAEAGETEQREFSADWTRKNYMENRFNNGHLQK